MKNLNDLKKAIENKVPLVWNDPDPIPGNNYTISYVEELTDDVDEISPILIQYNNGRSEAQVYLHEIEIDYYKIVTQFLEYEEALTKDKDTASRIKILLIELNIWKDGDKSFRESKS